MKKRTLMVMIALLFSLAAMLSGCGMLSANNYTEEEHLERIEERARKRFLGKDSEYTDLEVFPIYDENDEFHYALIELQPTGYMYIEINHENYLELFGGPGMYLAENFAPGTWIPFRVIEETGIYFEDSQGNTYHNTHNEYFLDDNGEPIEYSQSHFAVAGIKEEKRYFLKTPSHPIGRSTQLIPAVKRGDQYLDLIDGALIDYEPGVYYHTYAKGAAVFNADMSF